MKKKQTEEQEGKAQADVLRVAMQKLGYKDFLIYATSPYSVLSFVTLPMPDLLMLRARIDKLITENIK
jgi:tetrahydromethanopterin S-methyltransferase subunit H